MMRSWFCFNPKKTFVESTDVLASPSNHVEQKNKDAILTCSSAFRVKEHESKLKKALQEERRMSREAGTMVKFVTQGHARMDA